MLLSAAGTMMAAAPAPAQQQQASADASIEGDIIVSGQRGAAAATHIDAPIEDLPIAIQTVTAKLIEDQGFLRLSEATRNISGVVRKEAYLGVTDSFGIRGFDASTGLFNGFRHDFYGSTVDLVHVERIEVIKGPASVSTGYLEPGGIVDVVTKAPVARAGGELAVSGGSFGKSRVQADINRPVSEAIGLRLTGAYERGGSFRDWVNPRRWTVGGAVAWRLAPGTRLDLRAYYQHIVTTPDRGFDPDSLGEILFRLPRARFLGEPSDRYGVRDSDLSALLDQDLGGGWSMRTGVERHRDADRRAATQTTRLEADGRTVDREFTLVRSPGTDLNAYAEIHGDIDLGGLEQRLVVGVDGTRTAGSNDFRRYDTVAPIDIVAPVYAGAAAGLPPRLRLRRMVTSDRGGYAQDLVSLTPRWQTLLSLRYDRFAEWRDDRLARDVVRFHQGQLTPRLGVIHLFSDRLRAYANYARSFNPQTSTRLRTGGTPAPEQGEQYEVGVRYAARDDRLTASAALYQIRKRNVATPDPADPDFSILAGQERSRGIEGDLSARPLRPLQLVASYAHTDAVVTRDQAIPVGDHLLNVPRDQASLWARLDPPSLPVALGGGVFYVGAREAYLPNTFRVPGYARFDAALYYTLSERVELTANLQNLADRRYYDSQDSYIYPGAPRTLLATLRYRY